LSPRTQSKKKPAMPQKSTSDRGTAAVRLVGVGASAGGLEAFLELVSAIPASTGLAIVLIQHLDPHHASMLAGILAGATAIPVQEVVDGMRIERDRIYVIPPDTQMTVEGNALHLIPRIPKAPHRPLDTFFRSLALDWKTKAIGVVLSGNDADGALGLQAIRDAGGMTFAETPETAKFGIMPRAAAKAADFILSPAGIAERLVRVARGGAKQTKDPAEQGAVQSEQPAEPPAADFDRVLQLLRSFHAVDFGHFKRSSLERRILRRVLLGNHESLSAYADSLEKDSAEEKSR